MQSVDAKQMKVCFNVEEPMLHYFSVIWMEADWSSHVVTLVYSS